MTEKTLSNIYHKVTYKNKFTFEIFLGWMRPIGLCLYGWAAGGISNEFYRGFFAGLFGLLSAFFFIIAAITALCGFILAFYYLYKSTLDADEKDGKNLQAMQDALHWVAVTPWKVLIYLVKLVYKCVKKGVMLLTKRKNRK